MDELEKVELTIVRLKSAISNSLRMQEVMEFDMSERIDNLLDLLSQAMKKREELVKK